MIFRALVLVHVKALVELDIPTDSRAGLPVVSGFYNLDVAKEVL